MSKANGIWYTDEERKDAFCRSVGSALMTHPYDNGMYRSTRYIVVKRDIKTGGQCVMATGYVTFVSPDDNCNMQWRIYDLWVRMYPEDTKFIAFDGHNLISTGMLSSHDVLWGKLTDKYEAISSLLENQPND